jgi:S-adenosylmethionine decarboxylase
MMSAGLHVLGNLYGCPAEMLEKVDAVRQAMVNTVKEAELHQVGEVFHQFEPFGVTGVILISESHLSMHTWPENNFAAVDVFTCGNEGNAELAFEILCKHMKPERVEKQVVKR